MINSKGDLFMIRFLSSRIADFLWKKQIISDDDLEICIYGYELIISSLIGAGLVFILGAILRRLIDTVIFIAVFVSTRQYCGGYHANSYFKCIMTFSGVYCVVIALTTIMLNVYGLKVWLLIVIAAGSVIIELSPMENENKPMTDHEKRVNRTKSIVISLVLSAISAVIIMVSKEKSLLIALTLLSTAMLMIIENNKKEVN